MVKCFPSCIPRTFNTNKNRSTRYTAVIKNHIPDVRKAANKNDDEAIDDTNVILCVDERYHPQILNTLQKQNYRWYRRL